MPSGRSLLILLLVVLLLLAPARAGDRPAAPAWGEVADQLDWRPRPAWHAGAQGAADLAPLGDDRSAVIEWRDIIFFEPADAADRGVALGAVHPVGCAKIHRRVELGVVYPGLFIRVSDLVCGHGSSC